MKKQIAKMTTVFLITLAMVALFTASKKCCDAPKQLWNGNDFQGFAFAFNGKASEESGAFIAKDGVLVCAGNPRGYMYTKKSYSNYTLEADLKFMKPGNSGILVHIQDAPKKVLGIWPRCIEVQGMYKNMGLILPIPRNLKCTHTNNEEARKKVLKPLGEWNHLKIDVNGGDMEIRLNGSVVSTVTDCELTEGAIGFQSEGRETHWRNIRIKQK